MSRKLERQIARAQAPKPMTPAEEIVALKALAYDAVVQVQVLQQRIGQINARIAELTGQPAPPPAAAASEPSGD